MKVAKTVFIGSKVLLGTSHLVLQSLADLALHAETEIVKRTGYWDKDKQGKDVQTMLTEADITSYKTQRRAHTSKLQGVALEKYNKLSAMIDKKKNIAWNRA